MLLGAGGGGGGGEVVVAGGAVVVVVGGAVVVVVVVVVVAGAAPVPDSEADTLRSAWRASGTLSVPVAEPTALGWNCTEMLHVPAGGTVVPAQSSAVFENALEPLSVAAPGSRSAPPVLVTTNDRDEVEPRVTVPKDDDVGLIVNVVRGASPMPTSGTETVPWVPETSSVAPWVLWSVAENETVTLQRSVGSTACKPQPSAVMAKRSAPVPVIVGALITSVTSPVLRTWTVAVAAVPTAIGPIVAVAG